MLLKRWDELQTGYRPASGSIRKSFESWGYLHNESVNIYSHLIGSMLFVVLPIYIFRAEIPPRYKVATSADIGVCLIYFIGVAICFLLSATFHTIMNHSSKIDKLGMQLDFQGVILLMWGATIPLIYYGFYCDKTLQWVYWSLLSAFAVACSIVTFQPRFSDPFLRPLRAVTFGSLAFSSIIPIIHGIIKYGWALQSERMGLKWVLVTLGLNTLGAAAYAIKFPERWFKKTFDIFGASHQWLHIMVIVAGLAHTVGVLYAFDFLHAHPTECAIS
ncbi:hemolysin-III channel protein-like protein Izh2 [Hyaloscypha sp. PMI_1271]|nr:hemolysin-III channel protein-like protein Izh2 [Hyaloscypha sp. PMI_1271]